MPVFVLGRHCKKDLKNKMKSFQSVGKQVKEGNDCKLIKMCRVILWVNRGGNN